MTALHLPSAAVIVCTFSERRVPCLLRTLDCIHGQSCRPDEVFVVVDHNAQLLARLHAQGAQARILANTRTRGASGARNTAAEIACSQVLVFLDDDAEPEPDWLEHLLRQFDREEVAAVGGPSYPLWPTRRPDWFAPELDWIVGCSLPDAGTRARPVRNLWAVNMAVRGALLRRSGWFDESLSRTGTIPAGYEDTELCIRMARQIPRAEILFEPAAVVRHHVTAERCQAHYAIRRCFHEGQSKAKLAASNGWSTLTVERRYLLSGLAGGILRHVGQALRWRKPASELAQAGSLIVGSCAAACGYAVGIYRRRADCGTSVRS